MNKSYGGQAVLEDVSLTLPKGERVGLVGPNGGGKTTLLRIITGQEAPDSGHVSVDPAATLGYLPQGLDLATDQTLYEYVSSGIAGLGEAAQRVERLAHQMERSPEAVSRGLLDEYGEAVARLEALGGYEVEHRIETVLTGLGLGSTEPSRPLPQLSGGQRTRAGLARLVMAHPNLLVLDEPTNHLDIQALEWLEEFLAGYEGTILLVSHDWAFLDATVMRILELDGLTHHVTSYAGNYSAYAAEKERRSAKQWSAWKDQQLEIRRLEADIARTKAQARHNEEMTNNDHTRRLAKKVAQKAKAREQRLRRYLESQDRVEKPRQGWRMKLEFGDMPRSGQIVVELDDLGHTYDGRAPGEYSPSNNWLFRHASMTLVHGDRIALVGPNGSGKTTLARILAGELQPSEGSVRFGANVQLGYMPQEQENLDARATPLELIRAMAAMDETAARHFLHWFLFEEDDVFVRVEQLSYGERARLILAKLVVAGANCLLLDEPINHLDIPSRERFETALDAFPGTILVSVHDRAFIDRFATGIWAIEAGRLHSYIDREEMGRKKALDE